MIKKIAGLYQEHLVRKVLFYCNLYHIDLGKDGITHYNNEADAFKHCYWQAEMTLWFGPVIAEWIGNHHEDKPNNPQGEKKMDLHNNQAGRDIGMELLSKYPLWVFTPYYIVENSIANRIYRKLVNGELITKPTGGSNGIKD